MADALGGLMRVVMAVDPALHVAPRQTLLDLAA
jgi:hypothetical protein